MSLNNYATLLGENGRSEDALAMAKQALDVYERLAKGNPERFEKDWATSLSNYAGFLDDNGRSEDALAMVGQATEIRQRWAKKLPLKYGAMHRRGVLDQCFLSWLLGLDVCKELLPQPSDTIPVQHSKREWLGIAFYEQCVRACLTAGTSRQLEYAARALVKWGELDAALQHAFEEWFFVVAATVEAANTKQHRAAPLSDWKPRYEAMAKRRRGHIPAWLQTIAQRLGLKLPLT